MRIVGVEQVQHHEVDVVAVAHKKRGELVRHSLCAELSECEKVHGGFGEGIVHYAVKLIPRKITARVMPIFAYEHALRLQCFDAQAHLSPKSVADLVRDIQPPAVDVRLSDPIERDVGEIVRHIGV